MTINPRGLLDSELVELNQSILALGSMVDTAIGNAIEALMTNDATLAQNVIAGDAEINRLRFHVEERAYIVLATQQPMARDLRSVIAAMHFAIELERIGDHAAGIARIVTRMQDIPVIIEPWGASSWPVTEGAPEEAGVAAEAFSDGDGDDWSGDAAGRADDSGAAEGAGQPEGEAATEEPRPRLKLSRLPKMSKRARGMLKRAITAYVERDVEQAKAILRRDRKINRHYRKFFTEAIATMNVQSDAELLTYLLWIAHNLERIGDRTINLAERVIFMVTGHYTEVVEEYE
jgi:phosphate transport system protein